MSFNQTGADDTKPPNVTRFLINTPSINTASASARVGIHMRIQDDASGWSYCDISFSDPVVPGQSRSASSSSLALVNGTVTDGFAQFWISFPQYSSKGTWTLAFIQCSDSTGKWSLLREADILTSALSTTAITQAGDGDTAAPVITKLVILSSSINAASYSIPAVARVRIFFTDDSSGVAACSASFISTVSSTTISASTQLTLASLVAGSATNGSIILNITITPFTASGLWNLSTVSCSDSTGRQSTLTGPQIATIVDNGVNYFNQTGASDILAPLIATVALNISSISTAQESTTVFVFVNVTDDASGLSQCRATFYPPSGSISNSISGAVSVQQDARVLSWQPFIPLSFPRYAAMGLWGLGQVYCNDRTGKQGTFSIIAPFFVNQTGAADLVAPVIASIDLNVTVVDTSVRAVSIGMQLQVSDDVAGVKSCSALFRDATRSSAFTLSWAGDPVLAGQVQLVGSLARFSPSGLWSLESLRCMMSLYLVSWYFT